MTFSPCVQNSEKLYSNLGVYQAVLMSNGVFLERGNHDFSKGGLGNMDFSTNEFRVDSFLDSPSDIPVACRTQEGFEAGDIDLGTTRTFTQLNQPAYTMDLTHVAQIGVFQIKLNILNLHVILNLGEGVVHG